MIFFYAFLAILCLGLAPLFGKSALHNINPVTTLVIRTFIAAGLVGIWLIVTKTYIGFAALSLSNWLMIGIEAILAAVLGISLFLCPPERGCLRGCGSYVLRPAGNHFPRQSAVGPGRVTEAAAGRTGCHSRYDHIMWGLRPLVILHYCY